MSLSTAECSTSTFAYAKILIPVKAMRAGEKYGMKLGRAVRVLDPLVKPQEVLVLKSSKANRRIKINVHKNKAALDAGDTPTAVHLNWHGGGWILPGRGQDAIFLRQVLNNPLLADYPLTILDCDYALSPEWPCPADMEDARDVFDYVLANPKKFDPSKLTIGGFSTGGAIALGLSVAIGKEAREKAGSDDYVHPIKGVFAVYPVATWLGERDTVKVPREVEGMPGWVLPLWFSRYITNAHLFSPVRNNGLSKEEEMKRKEELVKQPIVSPACGENRDFSPIIVMYTVEYDHLSRDAELLRERFSKDDRIQLYGKKFSGLGHGWDQMAKKGKAGHAERDEAYDVAVRMIAMVGGLDAPIP